MAPPPRRQSNQHPPAPAPVPPYEPPYIPISASQIQHLSTISDGQGRSTPLDKLTTALSDTLRKLGDAAADLADFVPVGNDDQDDEWQERQDILDALEEEARSLVDASRKALDMKAVLATVVSDARDYGREVGRRQKDGEEDEHDATKIVGAREGVWGKYEDGVETKVREYQNQTMRQRYENVAEYVQFRQMVWSAQRGDANMPKANTWFKHLEGNRRKSQAQDDDDDGEDSDIEIAQEKQSYNCPLTLRTFEEPVTSTVCPHSFEKSAIDDYIKSGGGNGVSCPVPGCSKKLTLDTVRPDPVLERKVKRAAQKAERRRQEEEDEDEEDDEDEEMVDADDSPQKQSRSVPVKNEKGRTRTRGRARVLDIDSGEDE